MFGPQDDMDLLSLRDFFSIILNRMLGITGFQTKGCFRTQM